MEKMRTVDWMCIDIEKISETSASVEYAFVSGIYELDPRFRSRSTRIGQNRGILRVAK